MAGFKELDTFHYGRWNTTSNTYIAYFFHYRGNILPDSRVLEQFQWSQKRPPLISHYCWLFKRQANVPYDGTSGSRGKNNAAETDTAFKCLQPPDSINVDAAKIAYRIQQSQTFLEYVACSTSLVGTTNIVNT